MGSLGERDLLSNLEIRDILDILGRLEKRDILDILDILEIGDFLEIMDILEMGGRLPGFRDTVVSAWQAVLGSLEEGDIIRLTFHFVIFFLVMFKVRFLSCNKSTFRLRAIHRLPLQIPESFCNLLYLHSSLIFCL